MFTTLENYFSPSSTTDFIYGMLSGVTYLHIEMLAHYNIFRYLYFSLIFTFPFRMQYSHEIQFSPSEHLYPDHIPPLLVKVAFRFFTKL